MPVAVAAGNAGPAGNGPGAIAGALRSTVAGVTGLPDLSAYGLLAAGLVAVGVGLLIYNLTARKLST